MAELVLFIAGSSGGKESIEHVYGHVFRVLTSITQDEGIFAELLCMFCAILTRIVCRVAIFQLCLKTS